MKFVHECKSSFIGSIPGSPAIHSNEEGDADGGSSDFHYSSANQNEKQKVAGRILSWHMNYGRGEGTEAANYGKEVSHNYVHRLTNGQEVCQEASSIPSSA